MSGARKELALHAVGRTGVLNANSLGLLGTLLSPSDSSLLELFSGLLSYQMIVYFGLFCRVKCRSTIALILLALSVFIGRHMLPR
jgi:hypothetical protein